MKGFGRGNSLFTPEERAHIVREFEESTLTSAEIAQKYHIRDPHLVITWRKRLRDSQKNAIFAVGNDKRVVESVPMQEKTQEELEAEVKRLTKELEFAQLKVMALNTMIDIAEEQGIQIRKKSGAKQ